MSDTEAFDTLFDDKARAAHAAGPVGYDEEGVRQAVRLFLKSIGEDPDREGLLDTPDRIGRACKELFAGLGHGPEEVLKTKFKVDTDELVLVRDIELFSVCEHHLLPFHGVAHVGYIPSNGQVAGLSKLARLVELYALRPQVQERLTQQLDDELMEGNAVLFGRHRSTWRDRGHRMRPHVHGHECREEGAIAHGHVGGTRLHARRDDASRSHEPDPVAAFVIGATLQSRIVNNNNRI